MPLSHVGNTFRKCGVEFANHRLFPWQKRELSQPIVSVSSPQRASGWGSRSFSLTYSMTLYVLMPQNGSLLCLSDFAVALIKQKLGAQKQLGGHSDFTLKTLNTKEAF